jgi:hypothetical protein
MKKRRVTATDFLVTTRLKARLRHDGLVVSRHRKVLGEDDIRNAVQHAIASANLEGVTFRKSFVDKLYREAIDPTSEEHGKRRRAS